MDLVPSCCKGYTTDLSSFMGKKRQRTDVGSRDLHLTTRGSWAGCAVWEFT